MGSTEDRIKQARKYLGLSQKEMADLLGVSQGNISRYEQGMQNLPPEALTKLFEKGIDLTWLLVGYGEMLVSNQENLSTENDALKKEIEELDQDIARLSAESSVLANRLLRIKKLQGQ